MSYHQRNKSKSSLPSKTSLVIGLFIFLLFAQYVFNSGLKNIFHTIYKPVWVVRENVSRPFSGIQNFFKTKSSIITENTYLKDELVKLQLKEYDYDMLQKQNDELKSQLGRNHTAKKIISNILSKPPISPYDTFVVDAGSRDGVILGSRAYISEKIIVGVVSEVRMKTSIISLFSQGNRNTSAILERTGLSYNLVGQGGQNYKVEVPKDTDLVWGDIFTYPDGERSIVGSVYYIDTNSQSAFKTAYIKPPVNVFSYKTVLIQED